MTHTCNPSGNLRQRDFCEFETCLFYVVSSRPAWAIAKGENCKCFQLLKCQAFWRWSWIVNINIILEPHWKDSALLSGTLCPWRIGNKFQPETPVLFVAPLLFPRGLFLCQHDLGWRGMYPSWHFPPLRVTVLIAFLQPCPTVLVFLSQREVIAIITSRTWEIMSGAWLESRLPLCTMRSHCTDWDITNSQFFLGQWHLTFLLFLRNIHTQNRCGLGHGCSVEGEITRWMLLLWENRPGLSPPREDGKTNLLWTHKC